MLINAFAILLVGLIAGRWLTRGIGTALDRVAPTWRRWAVATTSRGWLVGGLAVVASAPFGLQYWYLWKTRAPTFVKFIHSMDWWVLGTGWCAGLALLMMWWGYRLDLSRGGTRCGHCAYDLAGLAIGQVCPECGRRPRSAGEPQQNHGHRGFKAVAMLLAAASIVIWRAPSIRENGWRAEVPVTLLILAFERAPVEWITESLPTASHNQYRTSVEPPPGPLWNWQSRLLEWKTLRLMDETEPRCELACQYYVLARNGKAIPRNEHEASAIVVMLTHGAVDDNSGELVAFGPLAQAAAELHAENRDLAERDISRWQRLFATGSPECQAAAIAVLIHQTKFPDTQLAPLLQTVGGRLLPRRYASSRLNPLAEIAAKHPDVLAKLFELTHHPDSSVSLAALHALCEVAVKHPDGRAWLADWLNSPDPLIAKMGLHMAPRFEQAVDLARIESAFTESQTPGSDRLSALIVLAANGCMGVEQQNACLAFLQQPEPLESCRRAALCLLCAEGLDGSVADALNKMRLAGEFGGSPAYTLDDYLHRISMLQPEPSQPK